MIFPKLLCAKYAKFYFLKKSNLKTGLPLEQRLNGNFLKILFLFRGKQFFAFLDSVFLFLGYAGKNRIYGFQLF